MKKLTGLVLLSLVLSGQVLAATFKPVKTLKSTQLNALAKEVKNIILAENVMNILTASDNANDVLTYSFTRKPEETDIKSMKQFNIKYFGQYADDEMGTTANEITSRFGKDVINALFVQTPIDQFSGDDEVVMKKVYNDLLKALLNRTNKLSDKTLKFFEADHADEDGSWGVVNILDTKNNEVLAIRLGYTGT